MSQEQRQKTLETIRLAFMNHLEFTLARDRHSATARDIFTALALSTRDHLVEGWLETQRAYHEAHTRRVYYLSMEFMIGRLLKNSLINLGLLELWNEALAAIGINLDAVAATEQDAGLGNGGLGRLAACFIDSMATLALPGYGFGLRYEHGIFAQRIIGGKQVELPDSWLRFGNPWELQRIDQMSVIRFGGSAELTANGWRWSGGEEVAAVPYDTPVPGYGCDNINTLRLWSARSPRDFDLGTFADGNYVGAVADKVKAENITKVLYPPDHTREGKLLRLKQEYFLVASAMRDILARFHRHNGVKVATLPEHVAIQMNDTHPALCVVELMRILLDEEGMEFAPALEVTRETLNYTNHTVLSEALERWPLSVLGELLPRHLPIVFEINKNLLDGVTVAFPGDVDRLRRMSIIDETGERHVRMANLAIAGSSAVNGVSELHSGILRNELFRDYNEYWPGKFRNVTNGVTPRRWLMAANRPLAALLDESIGAGWRRDFAEIEKLRGFIGDAPFMTRWRQVKELNRSRLCEAIRATTGIACNPQAMMDCHVKRIHEYKRQLLNVLACVDRYLRLCDGEDLVPRTILFAGKAAPSYVAAKLIIELIGGLSRLVAGDRRCRGLLDVVFLPNYSVSLGELIFPGADLSQQISTAGLEASGTGCMKFAINGALTLGTMDGANVEMAKHIGRENMFVFGKSCEEIAALRRAYTPSDCILSSPRLTRVLEFLSSGGLGSDCTRAVADVVAPLAARDDYFVLADFDSYVTAGTTADELYASTERWSEMAVLNVSSMGFFSSDRAVRQYAEDIWKIGPVPLDRDGHLCGNGDSCLNDKRTGTCPRRQKDVGSCAFSASGRLKR